MSPDTATAYSTSLALNDWTGSTDQSMRRRLPRHVLRHLPRQKLRLVEHPELCADVDRPEPGHAAVVDVRAEGDDLARVADPWLVEALARERRVPSVERPGAGRVARLRHADLHGVVVGRDVHGRHEPAPALGVEEDARVAERVRGSDQRLEAQRLQQRAPGRPHVHHRVHELDDVARAHRDLNVRGNVVAGVVARRPCEAREDAERAGRSRLRRGEADDVLRRHRRRRLERRLELGLAGHVAAARNDRLPAQHRRRSPLDGDENAVGGRPYARERGCRADQSRNPRHDAEPKATRGHAVLSLTRGRMSSRGARLQCALRADVAELVDAHGSGPCGRKLVEVQVLSSA